MQARIFKPAKTAMQSGRAGAQQKWVLEYAPSSPTRGRSADGLDQLRRHPPPAPSQF